jgi:hypothetical protein
MDDILRFNGFESSKIKTFKFLFDQIKQQAVKLGTAKTDE